MSSAQAQRRGRVGLLGGRLVAGASVEAAYFADDEPLPRCGLTRAEIRRRARESRLAQGLPPAIADPLTLDRMAAILLTIPVSDLGDGAA